MKKPSDEQIIEGANLLLRLDPSRNRGLYNSAMRRPQSLLAWIRTDLKKYLGIRQRGLEVSQVEHYNKASLKGVEKTLSYIPDSVSLAAEPAPRTGIPELGVRGRRKDHDALPEDIRLLWDKNADRWKQLAKMHYQLAQMVAKPGYAACDGNELCYQMRKLDDSIREDYKRYDSWQPSSAPKKQGKKQADSVDNFTDIPEADLQACYSREAEGYWYHHPKELSRCQGERTSVHCCALSVRSPFRPISDRGFIPLDCWAGSYRKWDCLTFGSAATAPVRPS